jgi:hypothetical protein
MYLDNNNLHGSMTAICEGNSVFLYNVTVDDSMKDCPLKECCSKVCAAADTSCNHLNNEEIMKKDFNAISRDSYVLADDFTLADSVEPVN